MELARIRSQEQRVSLADAGPESNVPARATKPGTPNGKVPSMVVEADDLTSAAQPNADASAHLLADQFDSLEAEKVIRRALELEAAALDQPHRFDTKQLERIAHEIGMDVGFVHQALGEVRLSPAERTRVDRWILPEDLIESATMSDLSRVEAEQAIERWMTGHEGLVARRRLTDGTIWDIDRRWATRIKVMQRSGGNRISRLAGSGVIHRLHSSTEHEHVVAVQSDGDAPLIMAKAAAALGALVVVFGAASAIGQGLGAFVQAGVLFGVAGVSIAAAGVLGARRLGRRIRAALRRSLTGLIDSLQPTRKGWFQRRRGGDSE